MKNYNQTCIYKWSPCLQSMAELDKILRVQDCFQALIAYTFFKKLACAPAILCRLGGHPGGMAN